MGLSRTGIRERYIQRDAQLECSEKSGRLSDVPVIGKPLHVFSNRGGVAMSLSGKTV
jgi:hypothetical protein